MSNYIFNPPQQNYHDNQKIDLGDIRVSVLTNVEIPEGVSQVIFNNNTIVDMSYDNVVPEVVHNGYMFHAANGNICTGTYDPVDLTQDTVNPNVVHNGYTFHDANGNICTGTYDPIEFPNHNLFVYINPLNFDDPLSDCHHRYQSLAAVNIFNSYGVYIGDYVTYCYEMFNNSRYYNKPVIIGNNVTNCSRMFNGCSIFNQPINIPDNVTNTSFMFNCCYEFNRPVTIGNNVINCSGTFQFCSNFNQPVTIGNNVTDMTYMFNGCSIFNQPVIIPDNVTNVVYMFYRCYNFNQNIYIKSTKITNARSMLNGCNNSRRKNIFCTNLAPFNETASIASITGSTMIWTAMTNGYYNATYNIYLYNNLPEDI